MSEFNINQILTGERLPISKRLENFKGEVVAPLIVDGYTFPMHSTYLFSRQKVYTQEPSRSLTGRMQFSEKFFIPYFTVTYDILPMQEYSAMMQLLEKNEVSVKYYDTFSNVFRTSNFYAQQPESTAMQPRLYQSDDEGSSVGILDKILGHEMRYGFMQNTTIIFAGTHSLDDIGVYDVVFYEKSQTTRSDYYQGEEVVMPQPTPIDGKAFVGWNTKQDGSGVNYAVGSRVAVASELKFYAIWR